MSSSASPSSMKHLLQFMPSPTPSLLLREEGEASTLELIGEHYLSLSDRRACIGYKSDEGWHACQNRALNVKQCPTCQYRDVARCYTVGDFTLYPHLYEELSSEKYVLYLAQFGADITKLGLTRRSRLQERWREQGADLAVALLEFDGPDQAYPAETLIQERYNLANAVRATQKLARLHHDHAKARARLESVLARLSADPALTPYWLGEPIVDMAAHYPVVSNPESVDFIGGKVLGAKGAWLFFEGPSGAHYTLNLHAAVGRFLLSAASAEGLSVGASGEGRLF